MRSLSCAWRGSAGGSAWRSFSSDDLRVIDLAELPEIPSIFDHSTRGDRPTLRFLHAFARAISDPSGRGRGARAEVIDYIPTQVVTEYFRYAFGVEHDAGRIDGVLYRSAQCDRGLCCALFIRRENCLGSSEQRETADTPAVELVAIDQIDDPLGP